MTLSGVRPPQLLGTANGPGAAGNTFNPAAGGLASIPAVAALASNQVPPPWHPSERLAA